MRHDDPRHGTYAGYQQHLRDGDRPSVDCPPCHDAMRAYQRVRPHLHALGKPPRVPLGEKAHRSLTLLAEHMTSIEIAAAIGVHDTQVRYMLTKGPDGLVARRTRARFATVEPAAILANHLTHVGAVRRIRALHAIGYTTGQLAEATGMCTDAIVTLRGCSKWSSATTRRKVADAYDRLHMTPQDRRNRFASRFYNMAEREGWIPPMGWDHIDDPSEHPGDVRRPKHRARTEVDPVIVDRLVAGRPVEDSTRAEKDEAMRRWLAMGNSEASLCRIHGWKDSRYGKGDAA